MKTTAKSNLLNLILLKPSRVTIIPTSFGESAEHVVSSNTVFIPLLLKVEVLLEVTRSKKTTKNNHQLIHYKTWPLEARTWSSFNWKNLDQKFSSDNYIIMATTN